MNDPTVDLRRLSHDLTEAVDALPDVLRVIQPGPGLASLVRHLRSVFELSRDGGVVGVDLVGGRVRVRAVVAVDARTPALRTVRAVRSTILEALSAAVGAMPVDVTVRVVEIA
jgi:hypothetical protein